GTGKTMIAINLIKNKLHQTEGTFPEEAKRTVFLAPTRELVNQHYHTVKSLVPANVTYLHGDKKVDLFSREQWDNYWQKYEVIIFTPQVLVGMCFIIRVCFS